MSATQRVLALLRLIGSAPGSLPLHCADCAHCCFLVRASLRLRPAVSFALGIAMVAAASSQCVAPEPSAVAAFVCTWALLNFAPFDAAFRAFRFLSAPISALGGVLCSLSAALAVERCFSSGDSYAVRVAVGAVTGASRHLLLSAAGTASHQRVRCSWPVLGWCAIASGVYDALLTRGVGGLCNRGGVCAAGALIEFVRYFISDSRISSVRVLLERVGGFFVPYYGRTWAPCVRAG